MGEIYEGVVTKIMEYGCFVRIEEGLRGSYNSELDWTNRNIKPNSVLSVSQKIKFRLSVLIKRPKNFISYKQF